LKILIGLFLSLIFVALAAIHIYWAVGGKSRASASIPTNEKGIPVMKPGFMDCLAVAAGLFCFGVFVLLRSEILFLSLPGWLFNYGLWLISAIFFFRAIGEFKYVGFFKKIKNTRFGQMDTKYYSPLCLLIAVLTVILEMVS
jgi:hypothetical protein